MNPTYWIAVALLAPLGVTQAQHKAVPNAAAPSASSAPGGYEALARLAPILGRHSAGGAGEARADLVRAMDELARGGDPRAFLWCARRVEDLSPLDRNQRVAEGFTALVREHSAASWLFSPDLDPLAALDSADGATRLAVAEALTAEPALDLPARRLALLLGAAALAPTHARDGHRAAEALALLDQLGSLAPADDLTARAADLAWRIEHLAPGRPSPRLLLRDVEGNELDLEDWRGANVLVDVWRSDDPDRTARARALTNLVERVRAQRPELGLRVLAVGLGHDELAFRRELEELELGWPTSFEPAAGGGAARSTWRLDASATTLWIDSEGVVRQRGGSLSELEQHLLARPASVQTSDDGVRSQERAQSATPEARR